MTPKFKTMILELIRDHPLIHYRLKAEKKLLLTVERQARRLKSRFEELQPILLQTQPDLDPDSAANAALEVALQEVKLRLESPQEDQEALSLDAAMAYLKASRKG